MTAITVNTIEITIQHYILSWNWLRSKVRYKNTHYFDKTIAVMGFFHFVRDRGGGGNKV